MKRGVITVAAPDGRLPLYYTMYTQQHSCQMPKYLNLRLMSLDRRPRCHVRERRAIGAAR
jgi:hypothetical protein